MVKTNAGHTLQTATNHPRAPLVRLDHELCVIRTFLLGGVFHLGDMPMKAHLQESEEPLTEGMDRIALCGALVSKAIFPGFWDVRELGSADLNSLRICQNCVARTGYGKRYIYSLLPGAEGESD